MEDVEEVGATVWQSIGDFLTTYQRPLLIVLIVVLAVLINWLLRRLLMRTVTRIVSGVKRAQNVDTTSEMQAAPYVNARAVQRTRTLGAVGRHIISWTVVVVALILVLGQLGVNLGALLTSAGIVAAGLAFGAQNVVKDILNGIFMVFEDQLGVGDWVTVGEISGTVEDVGIRVTQVRGIDGTLWFVRNGEILTLGNASQGWGRALIDITVEADADLDEVERVALASARSLMERPETARKIMGAPEVWGVESAFGDRVTMRLAMRTRPEAQWAVQRALRPVLVRNFAEAGIQLATELPHFPGGNK
ncbi:mechanosensitive ion channel family protein [Leucobacter massiliensis]|uniref:Small-conductance mechanosensitive channel n=1 Tax=Leucobacter massiliensis TaxID=1686285 RepID=A0A2S9QQT3_9MICO|nr:mechanosensitive ion channel family protein [Leucobacter massiliensis]PRI11963.1 small-conductance mechanosensitive channel [Leucobacter massiliensis]